MHTGSSILRRAFVASLPVLTGYVTMGFAAGVLLALHGGVDCAPLWAAVTSGTFISGPLQYLLVNWVREGTAYVDVVAIVVCLNVRYSLYGLSLIDRFNAAPFWTRLYLIGTVTDETYALETQCPWPPGRRSTRYCFLLTFFDHVYWILGVTAGACAGAALPFAAKGIDFAMTALFIVILVDQLRDRASRAPAAIGFAATLAATFATRLLFGSWKMLIPSMALILAALVVGRGKLTCAAREERP